jgi:cardiolipin synthase (CMP-forming)
LYAVQAQDISFNYNHFARFDARFLQEVRKRHALSPGAGVVLAVQSKGLALSIGEILLSHFTNGNIIARNIMATNPGSVTEQPSASRGSRLRGSRFWTAANLLTLIRIALTLPFLYLIKEGRFGYALLIFFIASVTDFADGYVARKFNQQSSLGRILDPLADKLLTTASFIVMALPHMGFPSIPVWLAVAVVARDLVILLGSVAVYLATGFKEFKPTLLGKVNTFLELGLIVVFLAFYTTGQLIFLLPLCYAIVITSVVLSGLEYVIQGIVILVSRQKAAR